MPRCRSTRLALLFLSGALLALAGAALLQAQADPLGPLQNLNGRQLPAELELSHGENGELESLTESFHLSRPQPQGPFEVSGHRALVQWPEGRETRQNWRLVLPAQAIEALLQTLAHADWRPASTEASVQAETDQDPSYELSCTLSRQHLRLFSSSSTADLSPWNLRLDDRLYVTSSPAVGHGLLALLGQLSRPEAPR